MQQAFRNTATTRVDWARAALAGLAGTIVFDLVGLALTRQWWDIPALLGAKTGTGLAGGVAAHYANGIILAVLYAALAPSLWGPGWLRALTYVTAETVFGVWLFMLPLAGAGVAGLGLGATVPLIVLARHWGYGLTLAWLYPLPQASTATASR
jgi:hypothetical protein